MNIYVAALVIFLTALVTILGTAWLTGRHEPAYLPGPPFAADPEPGYGPFPVDTGPLLILSEQAAARADLEREIPRLCAEAEAKIPPRWRCGRQARGELLHQGDP